MQITDQLLVATSQVKSAFSPSNSALMRRKAHELKEAAKNYATVQNLSFGAAALVGGVILGSVLSKTYETATFALVPLPQNYQYPVSSHGSPLLHALKSATAAIPTNERVSISTLFREAFTSLNPNFEKLHPGSIYIRGAVLGGSLGAGLPTLGFVSCIVNNYCRDHFLRGRSHI